MVKSVTKVMVYKTVANLVTSFFYSKPKNAKTFMFAPLIRSEVLSLKPKYGKYILVYQTSAFTQLLDILQKIDIEFIVYGFDREERIGNVTLKKMTTDIFLQDLAASLLISCMVSSLGILISLRSPTVQNAAQTIMLALFMPLLLLQAVVFLLPTFFPVEPIKAWLEQLDVGSIMTIILVTLVVVNVGLFLGANRRFRRSKLILS